MFSNQHRLRKRRPRYTRLRYEQLEQRRLLAGDSVEGIEAVSSDALGLQERFGALDVGVEVVNLSNGKCVATMGSGWSESCRAAVAENTVPETPLVRVGDVLAVFPVVDDTTTDVRVPSVVVFGYEAVQTAYEPDVFAAVPREFNFGYGQVIAQEVGTGTLAPVTTEVPGDLSLLSGTLDDVLADPDLTAYLEQFVNIHPLEIQIAPADDRPAAQDDQYDFVSDSAVQAAYDLTVSAEAGVLANDSRPVDAPLHAILIDPPQHEGFGSTAMVRSGTGRH